MDSSNSEKRRHTRAAYGATVDLTVNNNDYVVIIRDISLGGAFIAGDHLPPLNEEMHVILTIPRENKFGTAKINGTVRRITKGGVGIEFF